MVLGVLTDHAEYGLVVWISADIVRSHSGHGGLSTMEVSTMGGWRFYWCFRRFSLHSGHSLSGVHYVSTMGWEAPFHLAPET